MKSDEQEVRLIGENNYRRLLATYAVMLVLLSLLSYYFYLINEEALPGIAIGYISIIYLIWRFIFQPARNPSYLREELHFRKGSIWNKISVGNPANGEITPVYPLSVYAKDRHYRIYEPAQTKPLLEFQLDYVDKDPKLVDKMAASLGVEADFRLKYERVEKHLLFPEDHPSPKAFLPVANNSDQQLFRTPNNHFELYVDEHGIINYAWSDLGVLSAPNLRLLSVRKALLVTYQTQQKSITFAGVRSFSCSHYLREIIDNSWPYLAFTVYLHRGKNVVELLNMSFHIMESRQRQRIDLIEDVQVFQEDLLTRLREINLGIPYHNAPERLNA